MSKYKHIFFDLDRTLWDFEANSLITFKEIYENYKLYNFFENFEDFHSKYKIINNDLWDKYRKKIISKNDLSWKRFYNTLKDAGCDNKNMACEIADYYVKQGPKKTKLLPYATECLNYLSNKYELYIITNGFKEPQLYKIKNCDLEKYFTRVYISEDIGFNKPFNGFFEFILKDSGADLNNSLVIGDDIDVDIKGAYNTGIDSVLLSSNHKKSNPEPTYRINCLSQLSKIL